MVAIRLALANLGLGTLDRGPECRENGLEGAKNGAMGAISDPGRTLLISLWRLSGAAPTNPARWPQPADRHATSGPLHRSGEGPSAPSRRRTAHWRRPAECRGPRRRGRPGE